MPTDNERKALWFLALVALSGSGVRLWRSHATPVPAADASALRRHIERVDSARSVGRSQRAGRKPSPRRDPPPAATPQQPIDLDRATAVDIESLPGIGPALAQRIVANRDSLGSFGELDALCQVRGVGPGLAERLRPLVTFTGARRPVSVACGDASKKAPKSRVVRHRQPR